MPVKHKGQEQKENLGHKVATASQLKNSCGLVLCVRGGSSNRHINMPCYKTHRTVQLPNAEDTGDARFTANQFSHSISTYSKVTGKFGH